MRVPGLNDALQVAVRRAVTAQLAMDEAVILSNICEHLCGEFGRIPPGTVLLRRPGHMSGFTEWVMP